MDVLGERRALGDEGKEEGFFSAERSRTNEELDDEEGVEHDAESSDDGGELVLEWDGVVAEVGRIESVEGVGSIINASSESDGAGTG